MGESMTEGTPVYAMPGTRFFDLMPAKGGEPYRIFLSIPGGEPPAEGWPLLVTTDGNATFPFAVASLVTQAPYPTGTNVGWGVVAAIGYPSDDPYNAMRRAWDLGPPPTKSYPPYFEGGPPVLIGGTGELLDLIEHELLPKIAAMVRLDPTRRSLFGHSFGGLFTLFSLFERPGLFKNWIAASPTIYWEGSEMHRGTHRSCIYLPANTKAMNWHRSSTGTRMPRHASKSGKRRGLYRLPERWLFV